MRSIALLLTTFTTTVSAQAALFPEYDLTATPGNDDEWVDRMEVHRPDHVHALELTTARPPCGVVGLGRSRLDGGLASRPRDPDLPCRAVWEDTVRLELGIHGGGRVGESNGGVGGLSLALGVRFSELFSVYYLFMATGGVWNRDPGRSWTVGLWSTAMFEFGIAPRLRVGAGPSIDMDAGCEVGGQETTCFAEPSYGAHTRVTVEVAELPFGGLTITGDMHLGLRDGVEPTLLLGVGLRF